MQAWVRSALEHGLRRVVLRRHLPAAFNHAPLLVSPSCGLKYLMHSPARADAGLLSLVQEFVRPGCVAWDIGANLGLFTTAAAAIAGPHGGILAVEADVWLVQLLRRCASLQPAGSAPITVVPAAAASEVALRRFMIAARSRAANFLQGYGTTQTGGAREEHVVVALTLDWLLDHHAAPAVVKIDVEGAECEVLRGARRLLETARPVILCEVSTETSAEVSAQLLTNGYRIYDGEEPARQRSPRSRAPWNTVAIPE